MSNIPYETLPVKTVLISADSFVVVDKSTGAPEKLIISTLDDRYLLLNKVDTGVDGVIPVLSGPDDIVKNGSAVVTYNSKLYFFHTNLTTDLTKGYQTGYELDNKTNPNKIIRFKTAGKWSSFIVDKVYTL